MTTVATASNYQTIRLRRTAQDAYPAISFCVDLSTLTPASLTTALQQAGIAVTVLSLADRTAHRLDAILTKRHPTFGISLRLEIFDNDRDTVRARYPRLLAAMKWVAILSESEATGAIIDYREGRRFGCEAVNHFGGTHRVIAEATRVRHTVRTFANESRNAT